MKAARVLISLMTASAVALAAVIYLLFFHLWLAAGILGGVAVASFVLGSALLRRVDKSQLEAISAKNQRWMEVWARSVGGASGGWDPRRRKDRP